MKVLASILLLTASALGHATDDVHGCYAVHELIKTSDGEAHQVDDKPIRLTSEPAHLPWAAEGFRVVPAFSTDQFGYSAAYWARERDGLVVIFSDNGLSGVRFAMHATDSGFEGIGENFWDFQSPTNVRQVFLHRGGCNVFK